MDLRHAARKGANRSEAGLCVSRRLERRRVDSSTCPRASAATLVSIVDGTGGCCRGACGGVMTAGRISRLRASDVDEMSIIMRKKNARARRPSSSVVCTGKRLLMRLIVDFDAQEAPSWGAV